MSFAIWRSNSADDDGLRAGEFRVEPRFTVLQQHRDHFPEVRLPFVERRALAVRAGESRYVARVQSNSSLARARRTRHGDRYRMDFGDSNGGIGCKIGFSPIR